MSSQIVEAVQFGWGAALLEPALTGDGSLTDLATLLECVDPARLDGESRVDLIQLGERVAAMVAGVQQGALAAVVDATEALGLAGEDARHEVGAALRLAPVTAADRTRVGADLRDRLPSTLALLRRGIISYNQAAALARGVRELSDADAAAVEGRVLPRMGVQTAAETRRAVQAAVVAVDPDGAAQRHKKAVKDRRIERMPQADGMASWWLPLPADLEHDMWTQLSAQAAKEKAIRRAAGIDDPGLDALRVDALIDSVLGAGAAAARMSDPGRSDADQADAAEATEGSESAEPAMTKTPPRSTRRRSSRRCWRSCNPAARSVTTRPALEERGDGGSMCRGVRVAGGRLRRSWSTCPPRSGWPTTRGTYRDTALSPGRWPGGWPPTGTGSVGPSTPALGSYWTAAPKPTAPRNA